MDAFLARVRSAMEDYFGADRRRIEHALRVTSHAEALLEEIAADATVTLTAAYLHDIGIPEAERKHGSGAGPYQEKEGPPVARRLLGDLGADAGLIETVCALVGSHHTPAAIDSPEFRILWDADALVNLAEVMVDRNPRQRQALIDKSMVTEPGRRRARRIYLAETISP